MLLIIMEFCEWKKVGTFFKEILPYCISFTLEV
jgi:hypothetical protein